ncbi:MAG: PIG-L family deacetylase [Bryobacterales bacterium]|nr:PIG-L family deacetylase [Bryobacterales bacterium]
MRLLAIFALALTAAAADRTVLAIGAHAGDMELTTGALLARYAKAGDRVVILHLTLGERGKSTPNYAQQKRTEAEAAAKILGAEVRFGPWQDSQIPTTEDAARWLAAQIADVKPTTILTHWKNSIHKDHTATYRLVNDAILYAALDGARTVRATYYAENWEDAESFHPYVYIPVSADDIATWHKAAMAYEFAHTSSFDYLRYYEGLQKVRGAEARKPFALAFDIEEIGKRRILD